MKVNVITVVKEDLVGLKRTTKSLMEQTIPVNWIIVTPSNDSPTVEYVKELVALGLVKECFTDNGLGVYHAMNQAVSSSDQKDWIWFINAGDEFATIDSYERVAKEIDSTRSKWLYGGHYLGSAQGKILGELPTPKVFKPSNQLFAKKYISHQSTIFNAGFLQTLGGFDTKLKIAADWDLMVRAWNIDPGQRLDFVISKFYMGGLSTGARQIANQELLRIRKIHLSKEFLIKSYVWFFYRVLRNSVVLKVEENFPKAANLIRKHRIRLKRFINSI